jgi:hypothetical protein
MDSSSFKPQPSRAEPQPWVSSPTPQWISLAVLLGIFGYLLVFHYHHESTDGGDKHLGDFPTFYQAAQFAREHRDIYTAGRPPKQMYVYPPLIAFLYTPLTCLPRLQAAHLAMILTTLMILASLALAAKNIAGRMGLSGWGAVLPAMALVSILNLNEMRHQLTMLETDALMLLMFTLALCWLDRLPVCAGLALAFAFNIKYLTIVALPYLLLRRRWKSAAAMVIGSVFFALLPALMLGWNEDLRCVHVAFGGLLKWIGAAPAEANTPCLGILLGAASAAAKAQGISIHNIGDDLSLSITSALARLLSPRGFSNSAIMAVAAGVGFVALGVVTLLYRLNGFSLWKSPRPSALARPPFAALTALEWAGLIAVALVFSPDTNVRHLLLAVIVNTLGVAILLLPRTVRRDRAGTSPLPVIAALLLIFLSAIMPIRYLWTVFFNYGIPCWCLLAGYLVILRAGLGEVKNEE